MHFSTLSLALFTSSLVLAKPLPGSNEQAIAERDARADPLEVDVVVVPGSDRSVLTVPEVPALHGVMTPEELAALLGGGDNAVEEPVPVAPVPRELSRW